MFGDYNLPIVIWQIEDFCSSATAQFTFSLVEAGALYTIFQSYNVFNTRGVILDLVLFPVELLADDILILPDAHHPSQETTKI